MQVGAFLTFSWPQPICSTQLLRVVRESWAKVMQGRWGLQADWLLGKKTAHTAAYHRGGADPPHWVHMQLELSS